MINLDKVIDLINQEEAGEFTATQNRDLTGFSLLSRKHGTIAADVNEVNIPETLLLTGGTGSIGYEVYYASKHNKSVGLGGLGRVRIIDDDTMTDEMFVNYLYSLVLCGDRSMDKRDQMEDLLARISMIKTKVDLGEDSEDTDYLTFANSSMYLVDSASRGVYYVWLGYDTHEDSDLDRTRHNLLILCDSGRYLYRFSKEFFGPNNTSLGLELSDWTDIELPELEKEIEQYIYISRYNTIG